MKKYLLIGLLLLSFSSFSQGTFGLGGKSAGMAHASINNTDVWAMNHNVGALAYLESFEVSGYYENKYLLKELNVTGLAAAYPTKFGTFGLSASTFGFDLYRHSEIGFGYSLKLAKFISAGVKLNYLNYRFGLDYGVKHSFTAELGIMAKIKDKVAIGAHVYNITRTKMADFENERIPTIISLGVTYFVSDKINLTLEAEKDIDRQMSFKLGMDYQIHKMFSFRVGTSSGPWLATMGFGFNFKGLKIDLASSYHFQLGYSPQFSVSYQLPSKTKDPIEKKK